MNKFISSADAEPCCRCDGYKVGDGCKERIREDINYRDALASHLNKSSTFVSCRVGNASGTQKKNADEGSHST